LQSALSGPDLQAVIGKSIGIKFPPTVSLSPFHASSDGQPASDGRWRRETEPMNSPRGESGKSAAAPDAFKNALRFISLQYLLSLARHNSQFRTVVSGLRAHRLTGCLTPKWLAPQLTDRAWIRPAAESESSGNGPKTPATNERCPVFLPLSPPLFEVD
jgi:hypothetical protein